MKLRDCGFSALLAALVLFPGCVVKDTTAKCDYPHCRDWKIDTGEYVKNPNVKTRREYWAVGKNGAYAYLFPRPDGFRTIAEECAANGPNTELFQRYSLCAPAGSSAEVARVNGMSVEDALAVSTFLHEHLEFRAKAAPETGVEPFPYLDDELLACDESESARNGALKAVCDRAYARRDAKGSNDLGLRPYTAAETAAIVPLLNTVYGVGAR